MFSILPIIVFTIFGIVVAVFVLTIIKGISEWSRNNASPRLTTDATVVTKRMNVSTYSNAGSHSMAMVNSSTQYYVTFEIANGDRLEFTVHGDEYGVLVEGDHGKLTYQGTRFLGFARMITSM